MKNKTETTTTRLVCVRTESDGTVWQSVATPKGRKRYQSAKVPTMPEGFWGKWRKVKPCAQTGAACLRCK